jgi:hypothetical protein
VQIPPGHEPRLAELGITVPDVVPPVVVYQSAVRDGDRVLTLAPPIRLPAPGVTEIPSRRRRTSGTLTSPARSGVMDSREAIARCRAGDDSSMNRVDVPQAVPATHQVVAVIDAVCRAQLDMEYSNLCRAVVGKLSRKRPSPLTRGDPRIWAAGVVYAVGQLNFLFDPSQSPHATTDQLSEWQGLKKTTMANKARLIRDTPEVEPLRRPVHAPRPC